MDTNTASEVAALVEQAIKTADTSKSAVAQAAGIPWATFSRKINGHSEFTLSELLRIARVLGIRPGVLVPRVFAAAAA